MLIQQEETFFPFCPKRIENAFTKRRDQSHPRSQEILLAKEGFLMRNSLVRCDLFSKVFCSLSRKCVSNALPFLKTFRLVTLTECIMACFSRKRNLHCPCVQSYQTVLGFQRTFVFPITQWSKFLINRKCDKIFKTKFDYILLFSTIDAT